MTAVTIGRESAVDQAQKLLSPQRLGPYLDQSDGDLTKALALYRWSVSVAAAAFETLGQFEVILRNAIDVNLSEYYREETCGIPWFLLRPPMNDETEAAVNVVRSRLRDEHRESRHQVIASLSFGFWSGLLATRYEELWRAALHRAFPNSSGRRKQVAAAVEGIRKFRNRLAHHDSVLNVDIPFEMRRVMQVARFVGFEAESWLRSIDRSTEVYKLRPHSSIDTLVVPASYAWPFYEEHHAYVCPAGRSFQPVDRIAFYADHEIKIDVARIIDRRDNVPWTEQHASVLEKSSDRMDRKVAKVIRAARQAGWDHGIYQVFLLTHRGDPTHRCLAMPVRNHRSGRSSGFARGQRYVSLHALETAESTADL